VSGVVSFDSEHVSASIDIRQAIVSFSDQYVSDATLPAATTSGGIIYVGRKRCHSTRRTIPLRSICDKAHVSFS